MARWLALGPLSLSACGLVFGGDEPYSPIDPTSDDLAEFDALVEELEQRRTLELDAEVDAIQTAGDWLTWVYGDPSGEFAGRRVPSGATTTGPLPIGDRDTAWNYRLSETHAMTAHRAQGQVLYQAWRLADATIVDELELPEPASAMWSPYALLDDRAWVVEDQAGSHEVSSWQLGIEPPTSLGSLQQAGVDVGVLFEFGVAGSIEDPRLIALESGRLWLVDVETWTASWIETESEVGPRIAWTDDDLLFTTEDGGLHVLHFADGSRRRIDEEIAGSDWQLNDTYATIHLSTGDGATLIGDRVVYLGAAGPFAYDLGSGAIEPVLLEPRWDPDGAEPRIEYVELWPLAGDRVVLTGLESESGSVGADGPVYSVRLD